uniref:Peptidase A1 domain-containing protein n=1 Tax=Meloidogyne incognita TaxID=6306 RepID=A0A914KTI1_MELIC
MPFGTPPQTFNVLLSTGSADCWVTAFNVSTNKPRFFPQNSSTFSLPNPQKYLNFPSVQGIVGIDTVQFAGLSQAKLEFSFADIIENQTLAQPFDGIMGLTFTELSKSATKNPLMAAIDNSKYKLPKIFIVNHTQ